MHADFSNQPRTRGMNVHNYLWVGEGVNDAGVLREAVKNHTPHVVPCIHGSTCLICPGRCYTITLLEDRLASRTE